ncbi:hypothetical protein Tco_0651034 [Tanacetum coccineum]
MQNTDLNVHPTTSASTTTTTTFDLQQHLYLKMKTDLQAQAVDSELDDAFHKRDHDDHQGDDDPHEGEKGTKRQRTSKSSKSARGSSSKQPVQESKTSASKRQQQQQEWDEWVKDQVIDEDEVILEDNTLELIEEFQNVDKPIVWESRQEDLRRAKLNTLIFYGPQRNPNEPPMYLYNKNLFFLKCGNTEEKRYVLSLHKIHAISFPKEDLEDKLIRSINHKKVEDNPKELFFDHRIVEVVRVTTEQRHGFDYMDQIIVMRENDKPDSFSKADFKYRNKNDI